MGNDHTLGPRLFPDKRILLPLATASFKILSALKSLTGQIQGARHGQRRL